MDLRKRYRKRRLQRLLEGGRALVAFGGVLAMGVWGVFQLPYLRIQHLTIEGTDRVAEVHRVIGERWQSDYSLLLPGDSYFAFTETALEEDLITHGLGVAEIKKHFPATLNIFFPQPTYDVVVCAVLAAEADTEAGRCFYINTEGRLIEESPNMSPAALPTIVLREEGAVLPQVGEYVLTASTISTLKAYIAAYHTADIIITRLLLMSAPEAPYEYFRLYTSDGWYIDIDTQRAAAAVVADSLLLIDEKIGGAAERLEYIDMRFADKAYYRLR